MSNRPTRSTKLIYGQDDRPAFSKMVMLALQYFATAATFLLLSSLVIGQAHVTPEMAADLISLAMIVCATSALFQAVKWRYFGAGAFAAATPNPVFLSAALMAVKVGGIGLMAGMTLFAAVIQGVFTYGLRYLQKIFPPELSALLVCMIGLELGAMGIRHLTDTHNISVTASSMGVGLICLVIMFALHVWSQGLGKIFALLIGIVVGYVSLFIIGDISATHLEAIMQAPWLFMPCFPHIQYHFSMVLAVPFVIAALICAIKVVGAMTAIQQMQVEQWHDVDMPQIRRAGYADAATNVVAGLMGCLGYNMSSSMMALSVSTRICSRYIAYPYALIFILVALCPKISLVFIYVPQVIVGATLIYLGTNLMMAGFRILSPLLTTPERRYIVGLSFMLGMSYSISPFYYHQLPHAFQLFTGSSIAIATIFAVVLNFVLMLRLRDSA